ncbi:MAG TPA: hypothetical protein VFB02_04705, partial [Bradyrhizobium sp.]|nr:hypothetical protein [Bradyrhizobium sp.]
MPRIPSFPMAAPMVLLALLVAGCATAPQAPPEPAAPAVVPTLPPAFPNQELIGRWGYAAFHRPDDRARTEAAARAQCNKPYVISA